MNKILSAHSYSGGKGRMSITQSAYIYSVLYVTDPVAIGISKTGIVPAALEKFHVRAKSESRHVIG